MDPARDEGRERDAATLRVLGIFFSIMGGLVLIATYEAIGNTPAVVVSIVSGLVLLAVGLGMMRVSQNLRKPRPNPEEA